MDFGPPGFLTEDKQEALIRTTMHFDSVFAFDRSEKGMLSSAYADPYIIKTIPHSPWIGKNIPLPKAKANEIQSIYAEAIQAGDLEPSDSPYVTPHFFVEKKNGSLRKVVDLSELNRVTIRDANIPPNIVEFTEQLAGRICYGSADAYSFFDQIALAPQSRPLTAIRTSLGLLQSTTLPQGATNSPAYAQRVSTHVFRDEIPMNAAVFVDDLIIKGPTSDYDNKLHVGTTLRRWFVEYLRTYSRCLRRYQHAGLTISGEKFIAIAPRLAMTGVIVDKEGRHADPAKVAKLEGWPCPPPDVSSLRGFLGLANYLRPFIQDFATIDEPLRKLLTGRFRWSDKATSAMRKIQQAASRHPVLSSIDYEHGGALILAVDSSTIAAGWALFQEDSNAVNGRRIIQYGSMGFGDVEQRYSQAKLELCGVYKSIRVLRYYIYGTKLILEVDAASLREMINSPDVPNAAMTRWIAYLKHFDIEVRHVPAKKHTLPDGLSRTDFENNEPAEDWPEEKIGLSAQSPRDITSENNTATYKEPRPLTETLPTENPETNKNDMTEEDESETESSTEEREGLDTSGTFDETKYTGKWLQLGRFLSSGAQHKTIADLPAPRRRWIKKQIGRYFTRDGQLFRKRENELPVLVIDDPKDKANILHEAHEAYGHRGRDAMLALLSKRVWWEKLGLDCFEHSSTCDPCQRRRHGMEREGFNPIGIPRLFTRFDMDLVDLGPGVGPKRYLIVARDALTGWPEARLLTDKTSASVRTFLEEDVIARYGSTIHTILTDNGPENAGETAWIVHHLGFNHAHSTAYNPEGNSLVERGHSPLVEGLLKASYDDRARTSDYLPSILWADRITSKRTTGFSPYELVYGMDPLLPMDVELKTFVAYDWDAIYTTSDLLATRARQLKRRTDDLETAKLRLQHARAQGRAYADEREGHQLREPIGQDELVLLYNPTHAHRAQDRWMGPYRVAKQRPGGSYHLNELDGAPYSRIVAAKHIRRYHNRPQPLDKDVPADASPPAAEKEKEAAQDLAPTTVPTRQDPIPHQEPPALRLPRARMTRPALPHRDIPPQPPPLQQDRINERTRFYQDTQHHQPPQQWDYGRQGMNPFHYDPYVTQQCRPPYSSYDIQPLQTFLYQPASLLHQSSGLQPLQHPMYPYSQ